MNRPGHSIKPGAISRESAELGRWNFFTSGKDFSVVYLRMVLNTKRSTLDTAAEGCYRMLSFFKGAKP